MCVGNFRHDLNDINFYTLTEQCASAHYHGEISSPASAIIVDIVCGKQTLQNLLVVGA